MARITLRSTTQAYCQAPCKYILCIVELELLHDDPAEVEKSLFLYLHWAGSVFNDQGVPKPGRRVRIEEEATKSRERSFICLPRSGLYASSSHQMRRV
jgi:hypothetical protein